jgi:hypothetical protein
MAKRKRGPKRRRGGMRRRGGTAVGDAKKGIRGYKKIAGALGVRKGLAQAGKMLMGTGLRKLGSFLNR